MSRSEVVAAWFEGCENSEKELVKAPGRRRQTKGPETRVITRFSGPCAVTAALVEMGGIEFRCGRFLGPH
jgi:hypothetical protein